MNSTIRTIIIVAAAALVLLVWPISVYNGLVNKDETVSQAWGNVESVYQRRADLIPNLVSTVKGAADFEKSTLTDVIEARANATAIKLDANDLNPESIQKFQKAQDQLSGSLSRLLVSVEKYPELRATEAFRDLQAQLEGTENRIAVERMKFNEVVKSYNSSIRTFPGSIVKNFGDFQPKGYFEAAEGSDKAPEVKF